MFLSMNFIYIHIRRCCLLYIYVFVNCMGVPDHRGLYNEAGFSLIEMTSGLTQGFCTMKVIHFLPGCIAMVSNLLQRRLCSR